MTLQLLHSEFPKIRGKFIFIFHPCSVEGEGRTRWKCLVVEGIRVQVLKLPSAYVEK